MQPFKKTLILKESLITEPIRVPWHNLSYNIQQLQEAFMTEPIRVPWHNVSYNIQQLQEAFMTEPGLYLH